MNRHQDHDQDVDEDQDEGEGPGYGTLWRRGNRGNSRFGDAVGGHFGSSPFHDIALRLAVGLGIGGGEEAKFC
jgi:hypothetical protein